MCFLLGKNFSRDPRFGNGACIFFLSALSTGNEISILRGHCRTDIYFDFFLLDNFICKSLFRLDIKILTLFKLKWVKSGFCWTLNDHYFQACCSDYSQLECRVWLKLCGLDTQLLSLKQSQDYFLTTRNNNDFTLRRRLKRDGTSFGCWFYSNL